MSPTNLPWPFAGAYPVSLAEWESHFNPRAAVPDFARFQQAQALASEAFRQEQTAATWVPDLPYGKGERHRLDWFRGRAGGPVHLFFHGGYWRGGDRKSVSFVARHLQAAGVHVALASYDLCPVVDLDQTVASAKEAFAWVARHAAAFGADPQRISVSGHSAGAHLCALLLCTDWVPWGLPADPIRAAVLSSGIFDPSPALSISVNEEIRLTPALAHRHNALLGLPSTAVQAWVIVGGAEPWRWVDMSLQYGQHLRRCGIDAAIEVLPGYHHFSILDTLEERDAVFTTVLRKAACR